MRALKSRFWTQTMVLSKGKGSKRGFEEGITVLVNNLVKIAVFGRFWWVLVHDFWAILVHFERFRGALKHPAIPHKSWGAEIVALSQIWFGVVTLSKPLRGISFRLENLHETLYLTSQNDSNCSKWPKRTQRRCIESIPSPFRHQFLAKRRFQARARHRLKIVDCTHFIVKIEVRITESPVDTLEQWIEVSVPEYAMGTLNSRLYCFSWRNAKQKA